MIWLATSGSARSNPLTIAIQVERAQFPEMFIKHTSRALAVMAENTTVAKEVGCTAATCKLGESGTWFKTVGGDVSHEDAEVSPAAESYGPVHGIQQQPGGGVPCHCLKWKGAKTNIW